VYIAVFITNRGTVSLSRAAINISVNDTLYCVARGYLFLYSNLEPTVPVTWLLPSIGIIIHI